MMNSTNGQRRWPSELRDFCKILVTSPGDLGFLIWKVKKLDKVFQFSSNGLCF